MRKLYLFKGLSSVMMLTLFVCLNFISKSAQGQASGYVFAATTGTYTPVNDATATNLSLVQADTYISPAQNIGFDFVYEGITYTQFKMSSNGFISLNPAGTSSLTGNDFSTANTTSRPILAPLWDDLDGRATGSVSKAYYEVTGTAPNRILTVEWRNWEWNYASATPVISFQVKLYETLNKIEFVYRQESGSVNAGTASIGISSATGSGSGSFLNLTTVSTPAVSSSTAVTDISTKPPTGQVYTFSPPTCFNPTGLNPTPATTGATIQYVEPTVLPSIGYQYEVRTSGAAGSGATGLVSSGNTAVGNTSVNLTGLTPATTYSFYLRSDCGSSDFSNWSSTSFTTLCNPSTSFNENFDGVTIPALPTCWSAVLRGTGLSTFATVKTIASNAHSTANAVEMYNSDSDPTDDMILVSPPVSNLSAGTHRLRFWAKNGTASQDIEIGTMDNNSATGVFTLLQTVDINTTYAEYTVDFSAYSGTDSYIAIRRLSTSTYTYVYVDDIVWEAIPSCEAPTLPQVVSFTNNSAEINWTAPTTGSPVDYQIFYSTSNTAPTSATTPLVTGASAPATITGLTPNSLYYVWVRTNCGGTDVSAWTSAISFRTLCDPISTLPWTEGFESLTTVGAGVLGSTCMTTQVVTGTNWTTANTAVRNSLGARTGTNYIWSRWSSDAWLYSPGLTLTAGVSYDFSFYYRLTDAINGFTITAAVGDNPSATNMTTTLGTITDPNNIVYQQAKYSFTPSATGVYYFGIRSASPTSAPWYFEVDDIEVSLTPSCNEPTGIQVSATNTTAQVDWTAPQVGTPVNYEIYYNTSNTAPTSGTTPNVTSASSPATLTGLTANTTYHLWIRTFCGGTDYSVWASLGTFTTLCNPFTSFNENFDGVTIPALPSCWSAVLRGTGLSTFATVKTIASNAHSTANAVEMYNSDSDPTDDMILVSPPVSNLSAGTHRLRFWAKNGTASQDIEIGTMDNNSATGVFTLLQTVDINTTYAEYTVDFSAYSGTDSYIAIRRLSTSTYTYVYVDDIVWEAIPSCEAPTLPQVVSFTNNSAEINWTAPTTGSPVDYQIFYSTSNTAPTSATTPLVTGASAPATITGLTPNSLYYVWVRTNCGGTDVSAWTSAISFRTLCDPISTLPWTEGFESLTTVGAGVLGSTCMTTQVVTGTNWTTANTAVRNSLGARTGTNYIWSRWSSDAWLYSPGLTLTAGVSYDFSFYYRLTDAINGFTITAAVGDNPSATNMTTTLGTITDPNNIVYQQAKYSFTPSATGVYYFGIRSASPTSAPWYFEVDDIEVTLTPTCTEPIDLIPSNVTTTGAQIDWTPPATGTVTDYSWELRTSGAAGSGATGLVSSGNTASNTVNFTTLTATTAYTFHLRTNCVSPDASVWTSVSFATIPGNDDCSNAITVYKSTPVTGTTVGSTPSMAADACATAGVADDDVWYKFTADYSGNASIAVTGVSATLDVVIVAYSGTCGSFTSIGCADGPGNGGSETANLTGLTAGETYYFRVWSYGAGAGSNGTFTVTVTGSALPVSLVNFRGEQSGSTNRLLWTTSTETNNKGFELERSSDGRNYSSIAFVATKAENGNTASPLNYSYNDIRPLAGNNYYRLKQIDKDGKSTYSNVVLLSRKVADITLSSVYPNPTTRDLNLVISSPKAERVTVIVTDLTGKVLMQRATQLMIGDNQETINIQQLAAGTYMIKAVCANGCETAVQRFVKQ